MIRLATVDDFKDVYRIVVSSIEAVYPNYYPRREGRRESGTSLYVQANNH